MKAESTERVCIRCGRSYEVEGPEESRVCPGCAIPRVVGFDYFGSIDVLEIVPEGSPYKVIIWRD